MWLAWATSRSSRVVVSYRTFAHWPREGNGRRCIGKSTTSTPAPSNSTTRYQVTRNRPTSNTKALISITLQK